MQKKVKAKFYVPIIFFILVCAYLPPLATSSQADIAADLNITSDQSTGINTSTQQVRVAAATPIEINGEVVVINNDDYETTAHHGAFEINTIAKVTIGGDGNMTVRTYNGDNYAHTFAFWVNSKNAQVEINKENRIITFAVDSVGGNLSSNDEVSALMMGRTGQQVTINAKELRLENNGYHRGYGIWTSIAQGSTATLIINADVYFADHSDGFVQEAFAIRHDGGNTTITGNSTFTLYGKGGVGIRAIRDELTLNGDTLIETKGNVSETIVVTSWGFQFTRAIPAFGVWNGATGYGTENQDGAKITFNGATSITTQGNAAIGVVTELEEGVTTFNGATQISTSGGQGRWGYPFASTVAAFGVYNASGVTNFNGDLNLETSGEAASGIYANSGIVNLNNYEDGTQATANITTNTASAHGIHALRGTVNGQALVNITTNGDGANGIYAAGAGLTQLNGQTTIATAGLASHAVFATNRGKVELKDVIINVQDPDAFAFYASDNYTSNSAMIKTDGLHQVTGNIQAEGYGAVNLNMTGDSYLAGHANRVGDNSDISINMTGSSVWQMTASSRVKNLNMEDGQAMVNFNGDFQTLEIENLSGNGIFNMRTDVVNENADNVRVTGTTSGSYIINVSNIGGMAVTGTERTKLVDTKDKNCTFKLVNNVLELGAWQYGLRAMNDGRGLFDPDDEGQYWELYALTNGSGKSKPSAPGSASVNTVIGRYLLGNAQLDTLIKRLGDLRGDFKHNQNGMWIRAFGGQTKSYDRHFVNGFNMDYWGTNLGYDRLLELDDGINLGNTYIGAFVGYAEGDINFKQAGRGKGDVENYAAGLYLTYIGDTGYYLDAVAKYSWSRNNFNVRDSAGAMVDGNTNASDIGLSLETGRRFRFGNNGYKANADEQGSWYVEPQAQLSWQRLGGGNFNAGNGLNMDVDSFDSLIGRVGTLVGYESANTNIYVKAFYLKELDGNMDIKANGHRISESLDDDWWVYGVGVTHQLNEQSSFYVDVERAEGRHLEQKWAVNAGFRLSF